MGEVVSTLGQYVEFSVSAQSDGGSITQEECPHVDAFALIMQAFRRSNALPQKWHIAMPNKKLELKNDFIDFLKRN